jgi:hypothetical protein
MKTLKSLEKQIAKLEQHFHPIRDPNLILPLPVTDAVRNNLAPNERIVEDYYQDTGGETVMWEERVTTDPSDMGKDFPHGAWDRRRFDADYRRSHQVTHIVWERKTRAKTPATPNLKPKERIKAEESLDSVLAREEEYNSHTRESGEDTPSPSTSLLDGS